jgi:hypothetical protein
MPEQKVGFQTVEIARGLLSAQLGFIADETGRIPASATDDFSLGYVTGFLDALMQRAGIEDQAEGITLIAILMTELFGEKAGADLCGRFLDSQHLPETQRGLMAGGNDSLAWLADPDKPPFGWYRHCK